MTEWGVVGVIIALVGLFFTLMKPISNLTKTITELTVVVRDLRKEMDEHRTNSKTSHERLWEHNEKQDNILSEHGQRLSTVEAKVGIKHN